MPSFVDVSGPPEGEFYLTSEIDTYTGHSSGPPFTVTIPSENFDTDVPAQAGHYSFSEIFGVPAPPGISYEVAVVAMH